MHKVVYGFMCIMFVVLASACSPVIPESVDKPQSNQEVSDNSTISLPEPTHLDCCTLPDTSIKSEIYPLNPEKKVYYIDEQIILTGLQTEIEAVIEEYNKNIGQELDIQINPDYRTNTEMNFLARLEQMQSSEKMVQTPFGPKVSDIVVNSYQLSREDSVGDVMEGIYKASKKLVADQGREDVRYGVFADPNYLVGRSNTSLEASPLCPEYSPANISNTAATADLFWNQWAFSSTVGIDLVSNGVRSVAATGDGVRVGIFDTSPFSETNTYLFDGQGWTTPTLTVHVSHPSLSNIPVVDKDRYDMRDHGLYVAGLVHAVAPDSEIHLVRALNEQGRGDLVGLIESISLFAEETINTRGSLSNTVINLSLGMNPPADPTMANLPSDLVDIINELVVEGGSNYTPVSNSAVPIVVFETLLGSLYNAGAVIVASTGNESTEADIEPSEVPADYSFVIGVSGSSLDQGRSCFANAGNIAGPAGNILPSCIAAGADACSTNPEQCLVSYTLHGHQGYAHWVGTSFAAPLVTGEAALILETNLSISPADVRTLIESDACNTGDLNLGVGVMNLNNALCPIVP